ncbi:Gx transporter family protein [Dendrosporobacter sp. 1207_IL3150]|uniref:Gx transporter family protein n=1 Tax=Dendrosporobacter sp. 1207_IL3150 TaxID=3084054 RepID=UPI002FD9EFE7
MRSRRTVLLGLFVAAASILHVIEASIPLPLPIPGVKLGLANIVSLFTLIVYGWRDALLVTTVRVFIGSLFSGTMFGPSFIMSLSGGVFCVLIMAVVYHKWSNIYSYIGISISGAVAHNIAQLISASFFIDSIGIFWYLPYLLILSVPTGMAVGMTTCFLKHKLEDNLKYS